MKSPQKGRHRRAFALGGVMSALAAALPNSAAADGLTLYGSVDAAVTASRSGAPGASTVKGLGSGVLSASRWGIRGNEDLGGGLQALFVLEAGLDLDTGSAKSFSGNPSAATPTLPNGPAGTGFNRRSVVGLQSTTFGTLLAGRDYTPFFYSGREADIFRYGLYGNIQAIVPVAGGSERWARASNALFYTSPTFAGFKGRAAYSFGSESGGGGAGSLPRRANRFVGVGADYVSGRLVVTGSYQQVWLPVVAGTPAAFTGDVAKRKDAMLGGRYAFGDYEVSGGHWKMGSPQNATDTWLGASATFGSGTVLAQVQRFRQDNPTGLERRGTVFGIGYIYSLSKRTTLYANYGQVSNNATASFGMLSSDTTVTAGAAGADPKAVAFGVRHSF
jgi:predicted porin